MAQQLIFTSVRRGIAPGSSGYCTAARGAALRPGLITRLEQLSVYAHRPAAPHPVLLSHRIVEVGGERYHVVSRIREAGLDFTQRTNFLAHHLVLEPAETRLDFSPAEVLLGWSGWYDRWEGEPGELPVVESHQLAASLDRLSPPCAAWQRVTGDAGWAAYPLQFSGGVCWRHRVLDEYELLALMGESLRLRAGGQPERLWGTTFTTYLGNILEASRFDWSAWNDADVVTAGRQLGSHQLEPEGLKGEPRGDMELVRTAREGFRATQPQPANPQKQGREQARNQRTGPIATARGFPGKLEKRPPPVGLPVVVPVLALVAVFFGGLVYYGGKKIWDGQKKTETAEAIRGFYQGLRHSPEKNPEKLIGGDARLGSGNLPEVDRQTLRQIAAELRKETPNKFQVEKHAADLAKNYPALQDCEEARALIDQAGKKAEAAEKKTSLRTEILAFPKRKIEIQDDKLPDLIAELERLRGKWRELSTEEPFPLDDKLTEWFARLKKMDEAPVGQNPELAGERQKLMQEAEQFEGKIGPENIGIVRSYLEKKLPEAGPPAGPAGAGIGPLTEAFAKVQEAVLLEISEEKEAAEFFRQIGNQASPLYVLQGGLPKKWLTQNEGTIALWKKKKWETETLNEYFDSEGRRKGKLKFAPGEIPRLVQIGGTNLLVLPPGYPLPVSFSRLPGETPMEKLAKLRSYAAERILSEDKPDQPPRDRWVIQTTAILQGKSLRKEYDHLEEADLRAVSEEMGKSREAMEIRTNLSKILRRSPVETDREFKDNPWLGKVFADEGNTRNLQNWDNVFLSFNTNKFDEIKKKIGKESDKSPKNSEKIGKESDKSDGMRQLRELWGEEKNNKARENIFNGAELKENSEFEEVWKKANQRFQTLRKMTGLSVTATNLESMSYNNLKDTGFEKNQGQVSNALRAWREFMQLEAELQKLPKGPAEGSSLEKWLEDQMLGDGKNFTISLEREASDPPQICILKE